MTHRDELLALQARLEAQAREIDEARSENELLRAAHARKTHEAEELRRELDDLRVEDSELETPAGFEPPPEAHHVRVGRALRFASVGVALSMLGLMTMSAAVSMGARAQHARRAYSGAVPAASVTPLVRPGTVIETSGPELLAVGTRCTVERTPVTAGGFDCRVEVRCGDQTLYGADPRSGFVHCGGREVVRDANMSAFDGDPAMTLDLAHGTVTVEERVGLGTQRIRIQL